MTDHSKATVAKTGTGTTKGPKKATAGNSGKTPDHAMAIRWADPRTLVVNPGNPRFIEDADFKKLVRSIRQFPEMLQLRPVVIENEITRIILGGNMRNLAAIEAGLDLVPYLNAEFLTEEQRQEFIIKDNVGFGKWDTDALANEWDVNLLADWGLDLVPPGRVEKTTAKEDKFVIPPDLTTTIQVGDVIQIGPHRLICGDASNPTLVAQLMTGLLAAMAFTDPPARPDQEIQAFMAQVFANIKEHTHDDAALYCFFPSRSHRDIQDAMTAGSWEVLQELIWNRGVSTGRTDYNQSHEPLFYAKKIGKKVRWYGERGQKTVLQHTRADLQQLRKDELITVLVSLQDTSTVWELDGDTIVFYQHPDQKPVTLAGRAIMNSSQEGEIVLDLFGGTGTTMVAGDQLGRKVYAMELDPILCQVHINRMLAQSPELQVMINGKEASNG